MTLQAEIAVARQAAIARRAERGLGVAIREGQERGEVETKLEACSRGAAMRDGLDATQAFKPKPTDFARAHELSGVHGGGGIHGMTDNVSDAEFADVCRCRDCRRPLRHPASVACGRGPVCRARTAVVV